VSRVLLAVLLLGLCFSCAPDNAVGLSRSMECAAESLLASEERHEAVVTFAPRKDPGGAYTLVFLPDRPTKGEDLVDNGVARETAEDVFETLAYVEVGTRPLLIVHRGDGVMSFTGYWTKFAEVDDVLVFSGRGECEVVLEKVDDVVKITAVR